MHESRRALILGWLCLFAGTECLLAAEPVSAATTASGEVAVLDRAQGIYKFAANNTRSQPVRSFGIFEAIEFATEGDSYYVTLVKRGATSDIFTRLKRFNASGRLTGEWPLRQPGILAGVAIDAQRQMAYCSDALLGQVYQLDLRNSRSSLQPFVRIRDAGILAPMVFDAKRRRLLVADVEKGKIHSVNVDTNKVETFLDEGRISEPVALALDPANDRLYIADSAKKRIWVGGAAGSKLTVKSLTLSQKLSEPVGVAVSRDGTKIWVADRGARTLWQFTSSGAFVGKLGL